MPGSSRHSVFTSTVKAQHLLEIYQRVRVSFSELSSSSIAVALVASPSAGVISPRSPSTVDSSRRHSICEMRASFTDVA